MFDLVVIGAGVIGIAVARHFQVQHPRWNVLLMEEKSQFGQGISSRNSEVIHAGIYYPEDWLKSRLCIEGRRLLYPFLEKYRIPHRKTGKLVIATNPEQSVLLENLFTSAADKGVEGLTWLSGRDAMKMEPAIRCHSAILSKETGILSVHRYMEVMMGQFREAGGSFVPLTKFSHVDVAGEGEIRAVVHWENEEDVLTTRRIINAAGLYATDLANNAGFPSVPEVYFARGHYYRVQGARHVFRRLVYPVPDSVHLGTHVTLDLNDEVKLGPDVVYMEENREEYGTFLTLAETFIQRVRSDRKSVV